MCQCSGNPGLVTFLCEGRGRSQDGYTLLANQEAMCPEQGSANRTCRQTSLLLVFEDGLWTPSHLLMDSYGHVCAPLAKLNSYDRETEERDLWPTKLEIFTADMFGKGLSAPDLE